jgi:hypothetical protein
MELYAIGNVSNHKDNIHGNQLHLEYGRNKYHVYVGENTISCRDLYSKEDMHLIVDFIYDHGWMKKYDPYIVHKASLGLIEKQIYTGAKELL